MNIFKKILHLPYIGPMIGFYLGIKGYNRVRTIVSNPNGKVSLFRQFWNMVPSFNSRVNKGADLIGSLITGTSLNSIASPLPPKYIALSTSSLTPAATDTTLSGETSNSGVARTLGTQGSYTGPSSLDGAASYTVSNTFTCGATPTTVQSSALFDASSAGNMFAEANFSGSAALTNGMQLQVVWTVNF